MKKSLIVALLALYAITGTHNITSACNNKNCIIAEDDSIITPSERGVYSMSGLVSNINYIESENCDLITITDANENEYAFYSDSEDWEVGDIAACTVNNKGTITVKDDIIVFAEFSGTIDQFIKLLDMLEEI